MDREVTTIVSPDIAHDLSIRVQESQTQTAAPLRGSILILIQYDISEEIRLDVIRQLLQARNAQATFKSSQAPGYVRYQRPPVADRLEPLVLDSGERLTGEIKYFDYGVVSLVFELPFSGDWDKLIELSARWTSDTNFEKLANKVIRQRLERAAPALIKPYKEENWLQEDYYIFHVREIDGSPSAEELLSAQRNAIAQVVRGETATLAESERQEILSSRISYYPADLAVIGWNAAFIYDTQAGAETAIQLLQYANSQLLEFRHYDELMTRELENVYDFLETGGSGLWSRWRTARAASKLHTVLLDVSELTERADNAIKFLSDMYYARAYRMASSRVGVGDYRNLVDQKLRTARELYEFMTNEYHQARGFVLELLVVAILVVELVLLFK